MNTLTRVDPSFRNAVIVRRKAFWLWLLQRVTGLILALCILTHAAQAFFLRTGAVNSDYVSGRLFGSDTMAIFYGVFITTLVFHGANGVWAIFIDYGPARWLRAAVGFLLWCLGIAAAIWGYAILNALMRL